MDGVLIVEELGLEYASFIIDEELQSYSTACNKIYDDIIVELEYEFKYINKKS